MKNYTFPWLSLILIILCNPVFSQYHAGDSAVLRAIDQNCDNFNMLNWDSQSDLSLWIGVFWDNSDPKRVIQLSISDKYLINNLDVSDLSELMNLFCSVNQLTFIDVSNLQNLNNLACEENLIDSLDLTGVTNISGLYCNDNQITNLEVSQMHNLYYLYCYNNTIDSLDVTGVTNLYELICNNNQLKSLKVTNLLNLYSLNCSNNQLNNLNVSNLNNLSALYCKNNQIAGLNISNTSNIHYLDCDSNQLTNLNVSNLTYLRKLYCNDNKLDSLDITNLTEMDILSCMNNKLTRLDMSEMENPWMDFYCSHNKLPFSSIATGLDLEIFEYAPQDTLYFADTVTENITLDYSQEALINSTATQFVFYKDDIKVDSNNTGLYSTTGHGIYYCTMTNPLCPDLTLVTAKITVDMEPSSLDENPVISDIVYPNPTSDIINISLTDYKSPAQVNLYSISGELLREEGINAIHAEIDISEYPSGIYMIKIITPSQNYSEKIIKH